jgi:hypothetical protein
MKFKFDTTDADVIPEGKRTTRTTVRGSVTAYVGGKFWASLGETSNPHTETLVKEFMGK